MVFVLYLLLIRVVNLLLYLSHVLLGLVLGPGRSMVVLYHHYSLLLIMPCCCGIMTNHLIPCVPYKEGTTQCCIQHHQETTHREETRKISLTQIP